MGTCRLRRLIITLDFLATMFREGNKINLEVVKGLPADSRVCSISPHFTPYDPERHALSLIIESETFDDVQEGEIIPLCDPLLFVEHRDEVPTV